MCLLKWLPVPFVGLWKGRKDVPPLFFSHSCMRSVVFGRLDYLLLPTLLVVCLCSILRKKVLTGPTCIPWLWLVYPFSMVEPQEFTRPGLPMSDGCVLAVPSLKKYWRSSLGLPTNFLFDGISMICNMVYCFYLTSGSSFPSGSAVNVPFDFSNRLILSFWFFFLRKYLLGLVLGAMGFPFWVNPGWIISLHGLTGLHCWSELLISNEPPSLSIDSVHPLKRSKNNCY